MASKSTITNVTIDETTAYVTYSSGTEKTYPADRLPKTVQAWIDSNESNAKENIKFPITKESEGKSEPIKMTEEKPELTGLVDEEAVPVEQEAVTVEREVVSLEREVVSLEREVVSLEREVVSLEQAVKQVVKQVKPVRQSAIDVEWQSWMWDITDLFLILYRLGLICTAGLLSGVAMALPVIRAVIDETVAVVMEVLSWTWDALDLAREAAGIGLAWIASLI